MRVSSKDGMGHFFRVLGLFQSLTDRFIAHVFIVGDILPSQLAELGEMNWTYCDSDASCEISVKKWGAQMIIFDTLHFDSRAFYSLKSESIVVSISPIFEHLSSADLVFHRSAEVPPEWESPGFLPRVYKGLKYALISPGLLKVEDPIYEFYANESKLNIGLSLGGADVFNDTLMVLDSLSGLRREVVFWVVLGEGYIHAVDALIDVARTNRQEIIVVRSNETMWRIMRNVSVVITAGGMTTYEAAFAGIPSITVLRNPHWRFLVNELERANATQVLEIPQLKKGNLESTLGALVANRRKLLDMRQSAKDLNVNHGAEAVAEELSKELQIRRTGQQIR